MADTLATAEPTKPRRWYQFRLRTLLVGVAVLGSACGYVAYEANIMRERDAWVHSHPDAFFMCNETDFGYAKPASHKELPLIRRWTGDYPVDEVTLPPNASPADVAEARLLFPESEVVR